MKIKLIWSKYLERWIVKKMNDANIYELPDCENIRVIFEDLDKNEENTYLIETTRIDYGDDDNRADDGNPRLRESGY